MNGSALPSFSCTFSSGLHGGVTHGRRMLPTSIHSPTLRTVLILCCWESEGQVCLIWGSILMSPLANRLGSLPFTLNFSSISANYLVFILTYCFQLFKAWLRNNGVVYWGSSQRPQQFLSFQIGYISMKMVPQSECFNVYIYRMWWHILIYVHIAQGLIQAI